MKNILKKIKEQPREERIKKATFFAGFITFCIVVLWLYLLTFLPKKDVDKEIFQEKINDFHSAVSIETFSTEEGDLGNHSENRSIELKDNEDILNK
jgi:hypothetical protein